MVLHSVRTASRKLRRRPTSMNRTPLALIILRAVFVMVLVGIAALIINSEFVKASPPCRSQVWNRTAPMRLTMNRTRQGCPPSMARLSAIAAKV